MIQFNNITIYMKTIFEKEKKLLNLIEKLNDIEFSSINKEEHLKVLNNQKTQLEIEKNEISKKYEELKLDNENLKFKLEQLDKKRSIDQKKEIEFSEKIDELNQETDILIDEIDTWQT